MYRAFAVLAIAAGLVGCGCSREESSSEVKPAAPVKPLTPQEAMHERMKDPEYVKQLTLEVQKRQMAYKEAARIRAKLLEAKKLDPEGKGEDVKRLEAELKAKGEEIAAQQAVAKAKIRERMLADAGQGRTPDEIRKDAAAAALVRQKNVKKDSVAIEKGAK